MVLSPRKAEIGSVLLRYSLALPQGYDGVLRWPLILFLHGAGERGNDLSLVKTQALPKWLDRGQDIPFIVAAPQCASNLTWDNYLFVLVDFVKLLVGQLPVKVDQVYLTGISMGGYGTWSLGRLYPFAAIAPICGGMPWLADNVDVLKDTPVWAFHGAQDSVVPVTETRRAVEALRAVGGDVKYTEYPDLDHDCWTVTYDNPTLYEWFLQHKRA